MAALTTASTPLPWLTDIVHVEQKCAEAVTAAAAACAEDTAGQTCFICMDGGSLVRGCSCRGAASFAHVSCLERQAQVAVEGGTGPGWARWNECGLYEQHYHGVVACALGWACWKTYVERPGADGIRGAAMSVLGSGLHEAGHHGRVVRARGPVVSDAAPWRFGTQLPYRGGQHFVLIYSPWAA